MSTRAEAEFRSWLSRRESDASLRIAEIDVIAERALARGLVAALGIPHESPQALVFKEGALVWHGSHGTLTAELFRSQVD